MQATPDTQSTAAVTSSSSGDLSEGPWPLHSTPSLRTPAARPDPLADILANNCANGRQLRSKVWCHFVKAADYKTSKKATCVYCGNTFMSRRGTTTSMMQHLEKKHPDML